MPRGGKRTGAGRPQGSSNSSGMTTKAVKVSTEYPNSHYQQLPELLARVDHWEDELIAAKARGESVRTYEKLAFLIEEIRALGY